MSVSSEAVTNTIDEEANDVGPQSITKLEVSFKVIFYYVSMSFCL